MEDIKEAILGLAIWSLAERTDCNFYQARKAIDEEFKRYFSHNSIDMTATAMIHIMSNAKISIEG